MNYTPHAIGVFFLVVALMVFVGAPLQMWNVHVGLLASSFVAIALPAVAVLWWMRRDDARPRDLVRARLGAGAGGMFAIVLTTVVLALAASAGTGLLAHVHPKVLELSLLQQSFVLEMLYPPEGHLRVLALLAILVAAPLNEELLFRGVMLPLQRSGSARTAYLIGLNGMLFSLLHMNPLNALALAVIGAFFAHVALLTRSVWPAVVAHAVLNFINGFVVPELTRAGAVPDVLPLPTLAVATALLLPLTAALWLWCAKILPPPQHAYG